MKILFGLLIGLAIATGLAYWAVDSMGVSDPVSPIEMAVAETSCAPHGGLTTLSVRRRGGKTEMTVQCNDGAVTVFAPKPATKTHHQT